MKTRLPIQIAVPQPCNEGWEHMTPLEKGRFCDACQKCVTDFTGFTDEELYQFLMDNKGAKVCGRFKHTQLNRDILPYIPPQPQSQLYKWMIAAGLALIFSVTPESKLFAQAPVQQTQIVTTLDNEDKETEGDNTATITGTIVDENGEAIINALVELIINKKIIARAATDFDGKYIIKNVPITDVKIRAQYLGYGDYELFISKNELKNYTTYNISMDTVEFFLGGAHVIEENHIQEEAPLIDKHSTGNNRTISGDEIRNMSR